MARSNLKDVTWELATTALQVLGAALGEDTRMVLMTLVQDKDYRERMALRLRNGARKVNNLAPLRKRKTDKKK